MGTSMAGPGVTSTLTEADKDRLSEEIGSELRLLVQDPPRYLAAFDIHLKKLQGLYGPNGAQVMAGILIDTTKSADSDSWVIEKYTELNAMLPAFPRSLLSTQPPHPKTAEAFVDLCEAEEAGDYESARKLFELCESSAHEEGVEVPPAARMVKVRLDVREGIITQDFQSELLAASQCDIIKAMIRAVWESAEDPWDAAREIMLDFKKERGIDLGIAAYTIAVVAIAEAEKLSTLN